jgi:hypothetical protein
MDVLTTSGSNIHTRGTLVEARHRKEERWKLHRIALALAITLFMPMNAIAATKTQLASAENTIRVLYRDFVFESSDSRDAPWSPEIKQWLRRNDIASRGEVGVFNAVPFCNCQDTVPGARLLSVTAVSSGPMSARATASLRLERVERFTYDLRWLGGRWVIEDIHSRDIPSFLSMLRSEVPKAERQRR